MYGNRNYHRPPLDETSKIIWKILELYHDVTSSFFGIGILLVSDLLDFRYFGRYRSPLSPPLSFPPFFQKGVGAPQKGGHCPPFEEKGGHCPLFDTEMYRPSFPAVSVW